MHTINLVDAQTDSVCFPVRELITDDFHQLFAQARGRELIQVKTRGLKES